MPPRDLFIIAQVYRCCQYIILGDGRYKGAAPKRPDRRGQIAAMRQLCCRSCVSCRSKAILRRYKGSSKSKDREAPPQTALREGVELNSPSNMFLGLPLRSKSVLRNSGRICLANRSQGNVTGLPHPPPKGHACLIRMRQHAAFGPPPWQGGSMRRIES